MFPQRPIAVVFGEAGKKPEFTINHAGRVGFAQASIGTAIADQFQIIPEQLQRMGAIEAKVGIPPWDSRTTQTMPHPLHLDSLAIDAPLTPTLTTHAVVEQSVE